MTDNWNWVGRYVAVIVLALILAAALGSMDLFKTTAVMGKQLSAANIVKFLGYGAALTVLWLLGQRAALVLRRGAGRWGFLHHLTLPVVPLIVVPCAHSVILLVLKPLMDPALRNIYNWAFIAGIIASAGWLVMALFNQSSPLTEALTSAAQRLSSAKAQACSQCGAGTESGAKFCGQCGARIGA